MTTTTEIIKDAFRESNVIGVNATPTTPEQAEAMARLSSLISAVYGDDVGENFDDWMVGYENQYMPNYSWTELQWRHLIPNSRVLLNHTLTQTLWMPPRPYNGSRIRVIDVNSVLDTVSVTLDGNGRLIENAGILNLTTAGLQKTWFFDSDTANWQAIATVAIGDDMPFPPEFDDYFIIKLAGRLNPRYGRSLNEMSIARLAEQQDMLESTYRQKRNMPTQQGVLRTSDPNQRFFYQGNRRGKFGWM